MATTRLPAELGVRGGGNKDFVSECLNKNVANCKKKPSVLTQEIPILVFNLTFIETRKI
jgi:hypothetical protein